MIFTITNLGLVFPTPEGLNVNNPGWNEVEPGVNERRTTAVRGNMLLERSGRISVPELVEGRTEGYKLIENGKM